MMRSEALFVELFKRWARTQPRDLLEIDMASVEPAARKLAAMSMLANAAYAELEEQADACEDNAVVQLFRDALK